MAGDMKPLLMLSPFLGDLEKVLYKRRLLLIEDPTLKLSPGVKLVAGPGYWGETCRWATILLDIAPVSPKVLPCS